MKKICVNCRRFVFVLPTLDVDSVVALHNLVFWPAFLGSVSLGLVILACSWYEEARA